MPNTADPPDKTDATDDAQHDPATDKGILTRGRKKQPSDELSASVAKPKKKTVTFKNILETSDDLNIVKRVYNPAIVPAVPIIKISKSYDALSRSERFARGDIVMPSRLTEVLKNYSANLDIDKLSLLTFKSTNSAPVDTEDGLSQDADDTNPAADDVAGDPEAADDEAAGGATLSVGGDNKFVLPRRSAHSCRVIKPNKRFLDDSSVTTKAAAAVGKTGRRASTCCRNQLPADNFINNTLSSQINNSKLNETDDDVEKKDQTKADHGADSNSSDGSEGDTTENNTSKDSTPQRSPFNLFGTSATLFNHSSTQAFGSKPSTSLLAASKLILRQPRLNFQSSIGDSSAATEGPFSLNLNSIKPIASSKFSCQMLRTIFNPIILLAAQNLCSVCSSPTNKCHQTSRKFGFSSCEACRKFISKMLKTPPSSGSSEQCASGNCDLKPIPATKLSGHSKMFRSLVKERCQSCWLQKCIKLCPELKTKLPGSSAFAPTSTTTTQSNGTNSASQFRIKVEQQSDTPSISTNIFANNLGGVGKLLAWPAMEGATPGASGDSEYRPKMSISNALVENNSTFGSSPLIKPMITEKPVIMVDHKIKDENVDKPVKSAAKATATNSTVINTSKKTKEPLEEISRLRQRKKDVANGSTTSSNPPAPSSISSSGTTAPVPLVTAETAKRQRIDLKGPRVKHVCRSASIVLGQPLATFPPDEASVLENMDTPPRPDSPNSTSVELPSMLASQTMATDSSGNQSPCSDCKPNSPLSPPNTPTTIQTSDDNDLSDYTSAINTVNLILNNEDNQNESTPRTEEITMDDSNPITTTTIAEKTDETEVLKHESLKPITRKLSRPLALSSNKMPHNMTHHKQLNSFIRPTATTAGTLRAVAPKPCLLDIDFWENYDPAEVCQSGFGLIVTESVSLRALCFLCGSSGQDPLMFCVCCCEPYHQYCVEDEYNLKSQSLDEMNISTMEVSVHMGFNSFDICKQCNFPSSHRSPQSHNTPRD